MHIQDRIVDFLRCPSHKIRANPKNFRLHPIGQIDALKALFARFGNVSPALVFRMFDGTYETEGEGKDRRHVGTGTYKLIDGHARTEILGGDNLIPICVLDVTEQEADGLLLTFDPVTNLAGADLDRLEALMRENPFDEEPLQQMLADLMERSEAEQEGGGDSSGEGGGGDDFDAEPAAPDAPTRTNRGETWLISNKTVTCPNCQAKNTLR